MVLAREVIHRQPLASINSTRVARQLTATSSSQITLSYSPNCSASSTAMGRIEISRSSGLPTSSASMVATFHLHPQVSPISLTITYSASSRCFRRPRVADPQVLRSVAQLAFKCHLLGPPKATWTSSTSTITAITTHRRTMASFTTHRQQLQVEATSECPPNIIPVACPASVKRMTSRSISASIQTTPPTTLTLPQVEITRIKSEITWLITS